MKAVRIATYITGTVCLHAVTAPGATWTKIGECGFTTPASFMRDINRVRPNYIIRDHAGNLYATANNVNNATRTLPGPVVVSDHGGLSIFPASGGRIDVNVNTLGYHGNITKLVIGGDGKVYALQNWVEVQWGGNPGTPHCILRIHPNGTVDQIVNTGTNPLQSIRGIAVGGDGHVYFTKDGSHNSNKYHVFFRYNVNTNQVQASPMNGFINNGWLQTHRLMDLAYVGNNWFAILESGSGEPLTVSAISWINDRRNAVNGTADTVASGFYTNAQGRDHLLDLQWDPRFNRLWVAPRGANGRMIGSRWDGVDGAASLFNLPGSGITYANPASGIQAVRFWHGEDDPEYAFGFRWMSALAIHPDTGDGWMSVSGSEFFTHPIRGNVVRRNRLLQPTDEGEPEAGADVVGLTFGSNGHVYALVYNPTTTKYSVYDGGQVAFSDIVVPYTNVERVWSLYQ